jgi:type IV pilus assembly protein PilB
MRLKKIGKVLTDAGLITDEQLDKALLIQKSSRRRLGKVLIELGYIEEAQIANALSSQFSIPLVDCSKVSVSRDVLAYVPQSVAEKNIILPIECTDKKLTVVMADPLDYMCRDALSFSTGMKISVTVAPESEILEAVDRHYNVEKVEDWDLMKDLPTYEDAEFITKTPEEERDDNIQSIFNLSGAPPIVKLVTMVLVDAVKSRASDIHIEPQEKYVLVRYRVDGDLRNVLKFPKHIQESVISRIKIISSLDITKRRTPQDGRSVLRYENRNIDLRISSLPSVFGENIVIRLLDHTTGLVPLGRLGMPEKILLPLLKLASLPQGMILVTGPTGSGKSTTLYALLHHLITETQSIFTIEDPVEYKIQGITQVAVNEAVGVTFSGSLRSILRQDPDIIMVGEIRDRETADIAVRSALTGHLVLSTLHTNDTISTITRLVDIGLDNYLVSSAVNGLLAQRLVRRICPECKTECDRPLAIAGHALPLLENSYIGKGCSHCLNTGYFGQVGIYEFVLLDNRLKRLISRGVPEEELWDAAQEGGAVTLFKDACTKVREGITSVDEVLSKIPFRDTGDLSGVWPD